MMKSLIVSRMLAILSGIGGAAIGSLILADEPSTNLAHFVQQSTAAVLVAEESQRPRSSDATGSKAIKREIRELHEEVRVLRRDVNRLIELLQKQPTEAKPHIEPGPDGKRSSNDSKQVDEILSDDAGPVSDEFMWERIGIRSKPVKVKSNRYQGGLEVLAVRSGSPAGQQGFREGDILVGLAKWEVLSLDGLDFVLRQFGLKDEVTLKFYIIRGGATLFGQLKLPAVPKTDNASEAKLHSPSTASNPEFKEVWDLTLNNVVRIALQNSKVMRSLGAEFRTLDSSDNRIVVSHLNSEISATEIAIAARDLVSDVEESYWMVWKSHHHLESAREMRDAAQTLWKDVSKRYQQGTASSLAKAQADQQYFFFRSALEQSLQDLHQHQLQLRHVLGLAQSDGRLIHPTDEPAKTTAKLDWNDVHANALANGLELIQQRRVIEQCEIQLAAARKDVPENLLTQLGFSIADAISLSGVPVGHRRAIARVRNLELNLAREKARLEEMELMTSHLLSTTMQELDFAAASSQTHLYRATAAKAELKSVTASYEGGNTTLDVLLDVHRRLAQSEKDYHAATVGRAIAIKDINHQRGTLLEHRGVKLADGLSSEINADENLPAPTEGASANGVEHEFNGRN